MPDLAISEAGLRWLFPAWSGEGQLIRTLALLDDSAVDEHWALADVERRAARVLLGGSRAETDTWLASVAGWQDATPIVRHRQAEWTTRPTAHVDWARTRLRGWPPAEVHSSRRGRADEHVTQTVLGWTAHQLGETILRAGESVGDWPAVAVARAFASPGPRPTESDVQLLRHLAPPWPSVARVATDLLSANSGRGLRQLARRLIHPDGVPDRIFQLGVLGECALSLEAAGCTVQSLRPIDRLDGGPLYRIVAPDGSEWELWCEAGACWGAYGIASPHRQLTSGLRQATGPAFQPRSPRPDILLASRDTGTVAVIECKFPYETRDPAYVGGGVAQGLYYAHQLLAGFDYARVWVVGPHDLVGRTERATIARVDVAIGGPAEAAADLAQLVTSSRFATGERAGAEGAATP